MAITTTKISASGTADEPLAVDRVVLAVVNGPYKRDISAETLAGCIAHTNIDVWPVHVASFFTDLPPDLVFGFASVHGIAIGKVAETYRVLKANTGEQNPEFEAALVALAPVAC